MGIITTKEIELVVKKKPPTKKTIAPDGFTGKFFLFCFKNFVYYFSSIYLKDADWMYGQFWTLLFQQRKKTVLFPVNNNTCLETKPVTSMKHHYHLVALHETVAKNTETHWSAWNSRHKFYLLVTSVSEFLTDTNLQDSQTQTWTSLEFLKS